MGSKPIALAVSGRFFQTSPNMVGLLPFSEREHTEKGVYHV